MKMFSAFNMKSFLSIIAAALLANMSSAATITIGGSQELNCALTISGEIEAGDADRFRQFVSDHYFEISGSEVGQFPSIMVGQRRVCLDSPGGNIEEAFSIIDSMLFGYIPLSQDHIHWTTVQLLRMLGTAVPDRAVCESSCALIFMAGGWYMAEAMPEGLRHVDRVIHIGAKLGFHTFSLEIPQGMTYSSVDVREAVSISQFAAQALRERAHYMYFSPSLIINMFATAPDDMFYIEYVGDAASFGIQLSGLPQFEILTPRMAERACINVTAIASQGIRTADGYGDWGIPERVRTSSARFAGFVGGDFNMLFGSYGVNLPRWVEQYRLRHDLQILNQVMDQQSWTSSGYQLNCISSSEYGESDEFIDSDGRVFLRETLESGQPIRGNITDVRLAWLMYPGYVQLGALSEAVALDAHEMGPHAWWMPSVIEEHNAVCAQYLNGQLVALGGGTLAPNGYGIIGGDCTVSRRISEDFSGTQHSETLNVFPLGLNFFSEIEVPNDARGSDRVSQYQYFNSDDLNYLGGWRHGIDDPNDRSVAQSLSFDTTASRPNSLSGCYAHNDIGGLVSCFDGMDNFRSSLEDYLWR